MPAMLPALLVLIGLLLLWTLWTHLPTIILLFRPSAMRFELEALPVNGFQVRNAAVQRTLGQLELLGFKPLGLRLEVRPLWSREKVCSLVSEAKATYADVGRVGRRAWFAFVTEFGDGTWVLTSSFHRLSHEDAQSRIGGLRRRTPDEVFALHQERVRQWSGPARMPTSRLGGAARLRLCQAYYATPFARRVLRQDGLSSLVDLVAVTLVCAVVSWKIWHLL